MYSLGRLHVREKYSEHKKVTIRKTDIDVNQHVNNLNYLHLFSELMDFGEQFNHFRIVYKKEIKYGEKVIIEKEDEKWIFVKGTEEISGWIPASSVSKKKIISKKMANIRAEELALAGKCFGDEEETAYKKSGAANYEAVDKMESVFVSADELKEFLIKGNLNLE